MKKAKLQSLRALREEMKAVARGERRAPTDASKPSFNSIEALVRLLTPDNRRLLALIRDRKPDSVAELVAMTGRAQPNLTRTLAKLEAAGFIRMKRVGRRKTPSVAVKRIVVEIDPYSDRDRLRVARCEGEARMKTPKSGGNRSGDSRRLPNTSRNHDGPLEEGATAVFERSRPRVRRLPLLPRRPPGV